MYYGTSKFTLMQYKNNHQIQNNDSINVTKDNKQHLLQQIIAQIKLLPGSNQDQSYKRNMSKEYHVRYSHLHYHPPHRKTTFYQSSP
jgi:hypothetical protein